LQKNKLTTLAEGYQSVPFHNLFHLPMSSQAHQQMLQLQQEIQQLKLNEHADTWSYIWNSNKFSVKRAYRHLNGSQVVHLAHRWIWSSSCQSKHKVFFWLVLKDRISTRELLKRKKMQLPDYTCVLCNEAIEESLTHLMLGCQFARQCWAIVNVEVDLDLDPFKILESFKEQLGVHFFMEVIILMSWSIWRSRNDFIFRQIQPSIVSIKANFREEFGWLLLRAKRAYFPVIEQWIANLV
jgi:hypothetical protein